jgi:hypothetical protein
MASKQGFAQNLTIDTTGLGQAPAESPARLAIRDNLGRIFDGSFNGIEERAARATPLPEAWKRRYALSWFLADRMKLGVEDVRGNFENYRKLYFGEDSTDEDAYAKALLVRGHEDRIGEAKLKAPEVPGVLDLAIAEGISDPQMANFDPMAFAGGYDPNVEPGLGAEAARSVVRATASSLYGGAAGLANLAGLQETARKIAAYNAELQEILEARPDYRERVESLSGSWSQLLAPEWWATAGAEQATFAAQFLAGAGPATAGSKLLLSSRLAPTLGRGAFIAAETALAGAVLGAGEGLVESGQALGDIPAQAEEFRKMAEHLESLPAEEFLALYNKGMLRGAARYREMADRGVDPETAGAAAAKVFRDNLLVNAILGAMGLGAGRVASGRLFKSAKGKALSAILGAAGGMWTEIEQELKQNGIQSRAAMEAFTGQAVELDLLSPEILDAFLGEDKAKFDTAVATLLFSSKSTLVGLMMELGEARTLAEFEAKVREAEEAIGQAAQGEKSTPETRALYEELRQAKSPEEKAAVLAKATRDQVAEINRRLVEEEDLGNLEDELAVEELKGQEEAELAAVTAEEPAQAAPQKEEAPEPPSALPPPEPGPGVTRLEIETRLGQMNLEPGLIQVAESAAELPQAVLADAKARGYSLDAIEGLVAPDGKIYLVAANLPSLERAELVALHEAIGHLGIRKALGNSFDRVMNQIFAGRSEEEVLAIAQKYGFDLKTEWREAAEELLAKLAEKPQQAPELWEKVLAAIRQILRDLGFVREFSDADIRALLAKAREAVAVAAPGEARYSLNDTDRAYLAAAEAGDMETAQRMVDEAAEKAGYDLVPMYRGQSEPRNTGYTGFMFTTSEERAKTYAEGQNPTLLKVYLRAPKRPMRGKENAVASNGLNSAESIKDNLEWLAADPSGEFGGMGGDMYVLRGRGGDNTVKIPFRDEDVKSADPITRDDAGNVIPPSRRFQGGNPDIRFSLADTRRDPERDAAVVFAERLFRGEEVEKADVAAALKKAGADEAGAKGVLERARALAEQFEAEKEPAKTDSEIRAALQTLEIRNHYEGLIDAVYSQGSARGKYTEAAKQRLAEARKLEEERNLSARTGLDLEDLKNQDRYDLVERLRQAIIPAEPEKAEKPEEKAEPADKPADEAEGEETDAEAEVEPASPFDEPTPAELAFDPAKIEEIMAQVKERVRQTLIAEGVFTARMKNFEGNAVFKAEYRATMANALEAATKGLAYGRMREFIMANLAQLRQRLSVRSIDAGIVRIARKVQREGQRQGKREILRQIEKLLKSKKIFVRDTAAKDSLRKPISSAALRWLRLVKSVYRLKLESVQPDIQELQDWLNDTAGLGDGDQEKAKAFRKKLEAKYTALLDPGFRELDLDALALVLHQALFQYGALREKSLEEVGQAYEWIRADIAGGVEAQEKRRAERKADLAELKAVLAEAVLPQDRAAKPPPGDLAASVEQYATAVFGFQERLKDLIRFGSEPARARAQKALSSLDRRLSEAATTEDTIRREAWEELKAAVTAIYGREADQAIADLQKPRAEYAQFSTRQVPQYLSRASLIQMLATWEQPEYQEQLRENGRGEGYMARVRSALSKEDLALLGWLRGFYERNRIVLSAVSKRVSGVPTVSPNPLYMPAELEEMLGDLPTTVKAAVVIPKSLSERVKNSRDLDEAASVLTIWEDRLRQNAHFVSHAELSLDLRGIFGAPELQEAVRDTHGKKYLSQFLGHVVDIINGGAMSSSLSLPEKLRGYATFAGLGGNVKSMLSNLAGLPAFAHEIGLADTTRHFATFWSSEGMAAVREILQTQAAMNRYYFGNSESVRLALSQKDDNAVKKFARALMRTNTFGDGFALVVGQGIYREVLARELSRGVAEAEAKETASRELFAIIERTQASGQIKDLSEWQRRWGTAGRLLSQFVGPVTRLASYEIQAFREVSAGTPGAKRKLANTLIINHLLIPAVYQSVRYFWDWVLGKPPDEDELLAEYLVAAISGPASGLIIFGSMAESTLKKLIAGKSYGSGLAATSSVAGLAGDLGDLLAHLTWEFDTEEALGDAADVMGRVFRPFKDIRTLYENRIKD